jgi:mannose-6-phosphate isomerase-like protein (cupin superfamily)
MNPPETATRQREGYVLARAAGIDDVWWPYLPGAEVGRHTNKITGERSDGRLFQALMRYPRGSAPPVHIHHDADETFFVLDGEMTIFVGDERFECGPGDFIFGPRGVSHAFLVKSEWAEFLITFAPAGIEGFFAEVAPPVVPGEPPPETTEPGEDFTRLMAKYQCEFLAPPPTLD